MKAGGYWTDQKKLIAVFANMQNDLDSFAKDTQVGCWWNRESEQKQTRIPFIQTIRAIVLPNCVLQFSLKNGTQVIEENKGKDVKNLPVMEVGGVEKVAATCN